MLGTSLVDSPPDLFNAPDVSHLDSLNFGIETVMHLIVTGRFTNVTVLFRVCVARIKGTVPIMDLRCLSFGRSRTY